MPTQLSYSISTDPSTVTVNDTDVTLKVTATNKTSDPVAISYIVVQFPVGDVAGDLTDDVTSMTCTPPDDTWTGGSITPIPGKNQYYCQFSAPSGYTLKKLQSVSFSLGGIAIIGDPSSNVIITIGENSPLNTTTLNMGIYPAGWAQLAFGADSTNIGYGTSVNLSWSGGPADAEYTLSYMYNNAPVDEPATGTYLNVDSYTTPALTIDTTFTLKVTKGQMCFQAFVPITVALPSPEILSFTGSCGDSNLLIISWISTTDTQKVYASWSTDQIQLPNPQPFIFNDLNYPKGFSYYAFDPINLFVTAFNDNNPPTDFVPGNSKRLKKVYQTQFYIPDLVNIAANPGAGAITAIVSADNQMFYIVYKNGYLVAYNSVSGQVVQAVNLKLDSSIDLTGAVIFRDRIYFNSTQRNGAKNYYPQITCDTNTFTLSMGSLGELILDNGNSLTVGNFSNAQTYFILEDQYGHPVFFVFSPDPKSCFYTFLGPNGFGVYSSRLYPILAGLTPITFKMSWLSQYDDHGCGGAGPCIVVSVWGSIQKLGENNPMVVDVGSAKGTMVTSPIISQLFSNIFILNTTNNTTVGWTDHSSTNYSEISPFSINDTFLQIAYSQDGLYVFCLTADSIQVIDAQNPTGVISSVPIAISNEFIIDVHCQMYVMPVGPAPYPGGSYPIVLANDNRLLQLQWGYASSAT